LSWNFNRIQMAKQFFYFLQHVLKMNQFSSICIQTNQYNPAKIFFIKIYDHHHKN
jgi:hypothetical protein